MRRGPFTEDQIIGVLRQHEAGMTPAKFTNRPRHGREDTEANLSAA